MNKRELFEKISDLEEITIHVPTNMNLAEVNCLRKSEVLELIEQLDEPQRVTIPQFVADKIEYCQRASGYNLFYAMDYCFQYKDTADWLEANQSTFARAWLDGYEVEKGKLYTVEIPNPNYSDSDCKTVLKRTDENIIELCVFLRPDFKEDKFQLTESEIKQDFEWAWQWAKEVVE